MKSLFAGLLLIGVFSSVNAAFTRDAGNNYATDDVAGLDWLALSETRGQVYQDVESLNLGWRYATNIEMENMFDSLFVNYTDNQTNGSSDSSTGATYAEQSVDVARFQSLFGTSGGIGSYYSYGYYMDEDGIIRKGGVYGSPDRTIVYGMEYTSLYFNPGTSNQFYSTC